eukprot:TRINITY_DN6681_c0_g1_i1.p1 TRINITY_DN6681_c0_g1~~TRINITY_DN6681_c0_g1_i1.p1  ORF type:complete len:143 (-),score=17.14 TRINITY_DN6681_c0_g1_i1:99-527(-)
MDTKNQKEVYHFFATSLCYSPRLHMHCTQVALGFFLGRVTIFSTPVQLRARLLPLNRTNAPSAHPDAEEGETETESGHPTDLDSTWGDAILVVSARLRTLSPTTRVPSLHPMHMGKPSPRLLTNHHLQRCASSSASLETTSA